MAGHKVDLSGAPETMLATLYGRALDARAADPILGDRLADEIVGRVDYDFSKLNVTRNDAMSIAVRVKYVDRVAAQALATEGRVTVLHLACGLDTRAFRLDPDARLEWYDVDFPEVVELRRVLVPDRARYHLIGSSVTAEGWLEEVPADQAVLVVAEGLMQYLEKDDFIRLVQRIVERFPHGHLVFDSWNSLAARFGGHVRAIKATGAKTGGWGIDDPRELERWVPGLSFVGSQDFMNLPELTRAPLPARALVRLMRHVRVLRDLGLILTYRF
ncbi:class I SAM-dependent methyltransferase [Actinopolymorpha sp. B11F2]|uniref:class I SAM-dependent methyltransferase n=1 Tax=Actinopolymorpha sp. B11F2 TaxID=3160862 RepID=UPI0032E525FF